MTGLIGFNVLSHFLQVQIDYHFEEEQALRFEVIPLSSFTPTTSIQTHFMLPQSTKFQSFFYKE